MPSALKRKPMNFAVVGHVVSSVARLPETVQRQIPGEHRTEMRRRDHEGQHTEMRVVKERRKRGRAGRAGRSTGSW